ncbi:MAG TPA: hypothetical protein VI461_05205 [Chitinophagaceae bacterium]|nr:hypothetical protein [Chitinophagaceae bacterium]
MKRSVLTEKNLAVALFVVVLVVFSIAQEDSKKIGKIYLNTHSATTSKVDENARMDLNTKEITPAAELR